MGLLSYKGLFLIRLLLVFEPFYGEIRCYRSIVQRNQSPGKPKYGRLHTTPHCEGRVRAVHFDAISQSYRFLLACTNRT